MKVITIRVVDDLALEMEAVARVEDEPVSELIWAAIHREITVRKTDPRFQDRLRKLLERDREVIERLAAAG
jgi:hypothetical protein